MRPALHRSLVLSAAVSACSGFDLSDNLIVDTYTTSPTTVDFSSLSASPEDTATTAPVTTTTDPTTLDTPSTSSTSDSDSDSSTTTSEVDPTTDGPPPPTKRAPKTCDVDAPTSWVFVTPQRFYGDLTPVDPTSHELEEIIQATMGLDRGHAICNHLAAQNGLVGTYLAWLSAAGQPIKDKVKGLGPRQFINFSEECVADSWMMWLTTNHKAKIAPSDIGDRAWTGTYANGTPTESACFWWMNKAFLATTGDVQSKKLWSNTGLPHPCSTPNHLYCLQITD
jgi:hypothetical protein